MSARALWTVEAMADAMSAERQGALPQTVSGISIDSRTLAKGDAFFAIQGENRDGHDFVEAALRPAPGLRWSRRRGARDLPADAPFLRRARRARGLARARRRGTGAHAAKVIGVTGSVGKTGTKEALRLALGKDGETHASVASYNNHWGVPLSLARCPASAHYAVLEMGMNHAGEIAPLSRLARPHVAIITTIAPVHLGILRLARQNRRRQGGDFSRPRSGRRRGAQPRQFAIRAPETPRQGSGRRAHRVVRRA